MKKIFKELFVISAYTFIVWVSVKGFELLFMRIMEIESVFWKVVITLISLVVLIFIDIIWSKLLLKLFTLIVNISLIRDKPITLCFRIINNVILLFEALIIYKLYKADSIGIWIGLIYLFLLSCVLYAINSLIKKALVERSIEYFGIRNYF